MLWLCLAIAVGSIAAVTSLTSSIDRAIAANGRALIGGDLVVRSAQREAGPEELAALDAMGRTTKNVTMRATLIGPRGDPALAELSSIEAAWPLAGTLDLAPGGARPGDDQVAVGAALAERLGLVRGSKVRIGYGGFVVSAIIRQMPAMTGFALAPPALVSPAGLARTGLLQPGSLATTSYRLLLPPGTDPQRLGKSFQTRFPDGGWSVTDRKDAGNGLRRFFDRVGEMLLLVTLAALVIGGLGIASAATAFAASRRAIVATLKLLGAGRSTLAAMLTIEVVAVAVLAILAGLIVGALAPSLASTVLAGRLPITPDPSPQWLPLGSAALFGTLVTLGATWRPLAEAVATRPAALLRGLVDDETKPGSLLIPALAWLGAAALGVALASDTRLAAGGVATLAALAALFAGLGLLLRRVAWGLRQRGGPIMRLGIAALDRPGAATVRLSVALGLGLALLVALGATAQSLLRQIDEEVPTRAPALFLMDLPAAQESRFRAIAVRTIPDAQLRLVPSLRGPVTAVKGVPVARLPSIPEGAWILRGDRGLTFARDLPPGNRIIAGQWWPADYHGAPLVSLDADAARALGLKVGDSITVAVLGRPIEARIASLREIDWRSMGFNFAIIFAPGVLEHAPFSMMATVSPPSPAASTLPLERALATELPMVSAIRVADVVAQVRTLLLALDGAVRVATGVALILGVIVLAGAVAATRRARARDIVLLKLVGASRSAVLATLLVEFGVLGSVVTIAAFGAGIGAAALLLRRSFDLPFAPQWGWLAALAAGAILVTVATALLAALGALRTRPAAALRAL